MIPITFCIASSKNELDYTNLLLKSLQDNTNISNHEILIFIDSDNQNSYELLSSVKKTIPNLKLYKNETGYPFGSQRNVSIMFDAASNEIVCYLQSDMVAGKDLDRHIIENLRNENDILSFTRIEPSLHPPSPEKITMDFGLTPDEFKYHEFNSYVKNLQLENRENINSHFAPFALYKKTWFKLGGFDTQFRCSREDSDFIVRAKINDINLIQSWKACVYHFTCISSRGIDWYKKNNEETDYKNKLQMMADQQELARFIRKWGTFTHDIPKVYDIGFKMSLDKMVDFNVLLNIEPYVSNLFLDNKSVVDQLTSTLDFNSQYYANLRLNYSTYHWENVKSKFNPMDFTSRVIYEPNVDAIINDILIETTYSKYVSENTSNWITSNVIWNIHRIIDENDIGEYEIGPLDINIRRKNNLSKSRSIVNLNREELLQDPVCIFK